MVKNLGGDKIKYMTEKILQVLDVCKKYGKVTALENVNLEVERGNFFVILGPSGSGKSTLLKIIAGLEDPDRGEIYISGKLMNNVPPYKRPTSLVFQDLALFPHLNVYENIAYGLKVRKMDNSEIKKRVKWAAELLHIDNLLERRITQLSGGQQQRVALARSLVIEPEILLLDEPLGPLDLKIRRELQVELKKIQKKLGATWIYVTHDHEEAMTMSDMVAIINNGKLVACDAIKRLFERPSNRFVAEFLGYTNIFSAKIVSLNDQLITLESKGLLFETYNKSIKLNAENMLVLLRPDKIKIRDINTVGTSPKPNETVGQITSLSYKGLFTEAKIKITDGVELTVFYMGENSSNVGDRILLSWDREDVILMRGDEN
jgi:spermidine/putrescine transport system ATP-binding protein